MVTINRILREMNVNDILPKKKRKGGRHRLDHEAAMATIIAQDNRWEASETSVMWYVTHVKKGALCQQLSDEKRSIARGRNEVVLPTRVTHTLRRRARGANAYFVFFLAQNSQRRRSRLTCH